MTHTCSSLLLCILLFQLARNMHNKTPQFKTQSHANKILKELSNSEHCCLPRERGYVTLALNLIFQKTEDTQPDLVRCRIGSCYFEWGFVRKQKASVGTIQKQFREIKNSWGYHWFICICCYSIVPYEFYPAINKTIRHCKKEVSIVRFRTF